MTTQRNIDRFRQQLQSLGFSYDWDREVSTTDPAYYKWTQWIFLKLFEKGLAYQAEVPVNWCPALGELTRACLPRVRRGHSVKAKLSGKCIVLEGCRRFDAGN